MPYATVFTGKSAPARKTHPCVWCVEKINPGEKYVRTAGTYSGDFFNDHFHPECHAACKLFFAENPGDEFEPHSYKRGSSEPSRSLFTNSAGPYGGVVFTAGGVIVTNGQ